MEDVPSLSKEDYELMEIFYNNITSCNTSMVNKKQMDNLDMNGRICSMEQFKVGRQIIYNQFIIIISLI